MTDSGTWALFGKQLNKQLKGLKRQADEEEGQDDHKDDNKPVEVTHGKDNTDKTVEELQEGEEVPQARIVAYSDSDEDDFNRNKWQPASDTESEDQDTTSPSAVDHNTATVNVKQKQLIRRPPPGNKVSIEAGPSVVAVAGFVEQHVRPKLERLLVPQTAVRVMMLSALRSTQPKTGNRLEMLAMLIGFPATACRWLGVKYRPSKEMPAAVITAGHQLQALAVPAAAVRIASRLWRIWLIRKRRRRKPHRATAALQVNLDDSQDGESQTQGALADSSAQSSSNQPHSHQQPPFRSSQQNMQADSGSGVSNNGSSGLQHQQPAPSQQHLDLSGGGGGRAAKAAQQYAMEIAEMRHRLRASGVQLSARRFSDAELLRYGYACGLHKAQSAEEKAEATEQAVQRVQGTVDWLHKQKFLPSSQAGRWHKLMRWRGLDTEGRPVLVIQVTEACQTVHGLQADLLGRAVLSQVAQAVDEMLGDEEGDAEQAVAVLDATDAQLLPVTRKLDTIKAIAALLTQHYPARLHQLYLVNTPRVLKWVVTMARSALPQETQAKVQVCQSDSDLFPFPASILDMSADDYSSPDSPHQEEFADCNSSVVRRVIRRSLSAPAFKHSPLRRRLRGLPESKEDEVQGLGKGVDRIVKKKHSSKTIAIEAHSDSRAAIADLPDSTVSAAAAFMLLFTFMAAIYHRFVNQAFGPREASSTSSTTTSAR